MPADPNPTPAEILSAERVAEIEQHIVNLRNSTAFDRAVREQICASHLEPLLASHAALAARCAELEKATGLNAEGVQLLLAYKDRARLQRELADVERRIAEEEKRT